jgi:hypothetical protein
LLHAEYFVIEDFGLVSFLAYPNLFGIEGFVVVVSEIDVVRQVLILTLQMELFFTYRFEDILGYHFFVVQILTETYHFMN